MEKIKEDLNTLRHTVFTDWKLNIVKVSVFLKILVQLMQLLLKLQQ